MEDHMTNPSSEHIGPVDPNVREIDEQRLTGQNAVVLACLKRGTVLNARNALELGVMRLAARIHDLRSAGVVIRDRFDGSIKSYWTESHS